ncbi:MAG: serine/threonine protein kinase [Clostridiales bacterium]|nr:serine/threonine protein kinase [Clostridiales bacterium]
MNEIDSRLELLLKQYFPGWKAEKLLGSGSYGRVYRIYRENAGERYHSALKWIEYPRDPQEIRTLEAQGLSSDEIKAYYAKTAVALQREISILVRLKANSHIVSIEDHYVIDRDEGGFDLLIRMEELTPLSELIKSLTVRDAVKLGRDVCTALVDCATESIVHRDIKPDNIFRNHLGSYKLGDFGVAKHLYASEAAYSQKGTPLYMAPEVVNGESYDARADIYSLGLVLYKLLNAQRLPFEPAGRMPLPDEQSAARQKRIKGEKFPPPSQADEELGEVILKACAFDPEDRYSSAAEFLEALEGVDLSFDGDNPLIINEASAPREKDVQGETVNLATQNVRPKDDDEVQSGWIHKTGGDDETEIIDEFPPDTPPTPPDPPPEPESEPPKKHKTPYIIAAVIALIVIAVAGYLIFRPGAKGITNIEYTKNSIKSVLTWKGGKAPWSVQGENYGTLVCDSPKAELYLMPGAQYNFTITDADGLTATAAVNAPAEKKWDGEVNVFSARLYRYKVSPGETPETASSPRAAEAVSYSSEIGKEKQDGYFVLFRCVNPGADVSAECVITGGKQPVYQVITLPYAAQKEGGAVYISLNEALTELPENSEMVKLNVYIDSQTLYSGEWNIQ